MATVLLGATRLDALDLDTESEPPDRKSGEAKQRTRRRERGAVVGADFKYVIMARNLGDIAETWD